jgi:hypothetical protein
MLCDQLLSAIMLSVIISCVGAPNKDEPFNFELKRNWKKFLNPPKKVFWKIQNKK